MDPSTNSQPSDEPTEIMDNEHLDSTIKALRSHLGLAKNPGDKSTGPPPSPQPLFWVEVAPPSPRGAKCRLGCTKNIMEGEYRIAVNPGQHGYYGHQSSDYYHIHCFEKIADFSQADFLDRICPLTRNFIRLRNLQSAAGILDGNYLLDAGAERLVLEWKVTVGGLIDKRDGKEVETWDDASKPFHDLLQKSGSRNYTPQQVPGMTMFEFHLLSRTLAPIESDGPEDEDEWNLFEQFLAVTDDENDGPQIRNSLSKTLGGWRFAIRLATSDNLTEKGKELRDQMDPKAVRAVKRLAVTPMPDLQSAFQRTR